jgi:hypothetical protein
MGVSAAANVSKKRLIDVWAEVPSISEDFSFVRYNVVRLEQRVHLRDDHNCNITSLTDAAGGSMLGPIGTIGGAAIGIAGAAGGYI